MTDDDRAVDSWENEHPTRPMDERRSSTRAPLDVEVTLTSDSQFFAGLSGDVSAGGLFIQTYERHAVGSHLTVTFSLPMDTVQARGIVRWIRDGSDGAPPGIGIAFQDLAPDARASIEDFCRARPPLYHDVDGR